MDTKIRLPILPQPDDITCGPTCLHAIYHFYGDKLSLDEVIAGVRMVPSGGTLASLLALHALNNGYKASIYSYNLNIFDPTWFQAEADVLIAKLKAQMAFKPSERLQVACEAYTEFLKSGGKLLFEDLTTSLIRSYLIQGTPVIAGLSATYLYKCKREYGPYCISDDVRGEPSGHFVILTGYDSKRDEVFIADPYQANPVSKNHEYHISVDHLVCAILLGVFTYDANLLIIER